MKKSVPITIVLLLTIVLLFQTAEAQLPTACQPDQTILRLSHNTNAHAELATEPAVYQKYICYNQIFDSSGSGDRTCDGTNTIVALGDVANAHGQDPATNEAANSFTKYPYDVCYDGLTCTTVHEDDYTPQGGWEELFSLSSLTNAHFGEPGEYPYKVICTRQSVSTPDSCTLTNAYWEKTSASEGEQVNFIIEGQNCDGLQIRVDIYENDEPYRKATAVNMVGSKAVGTWTAEYVDDHALQGDPEFEFTAFLRSDTSKTIKSSNQVKVSQAAPQVCTIDDAHWEKTTARAGEQVNIILDGQNCKLGDLAVIENIYEEDAISDDSLGKIGLNPDTGLVLFDDQNKAVIPWTALWTNDAASFPDLFESNPPEYKFKTIQTINSQIVRTTSSNQLEVTSCFDGAQNGPEEGVDCGGDCSTGCPVTIPSECRINGATWSQSLAVKGEAVDMEVDGTEQCNGALITYEIWERDASFLNPDTKWDQTPPSQTFVAPYTTNPWTVTYFGEENGEGVYEFYFKASIETEGGTREAESGLLSVPISGEVPGPGPGPSEKPAFCDEDPIDFCLNYPNKTVCNNDEDLCNVGVNNAETCLWDDDAGVCGSTDIVQPECGNGVVEPGETCDGGELSEFSCSDLSSSLSGTGLGCNAPGTTNECHFDISNCIGALPGGTCGDGDFNYGEECEPLEDILTCTEFGFDSGSTACTDECLIDTTLCSLSGESSLFGTCRTTPTQTGDDCSDGVLRVTQTHVFLWNGQTWDGAALPVGTNTKVIENYDRCLAKPLEKIYSCSQEVALPFFGMFNIIMGITMISFIYFLYAIRKEKYSKKRG